MVFPFSPLPFPLLDSLSLGDSLSPKSPVTSSSFLSPRGLFLEDSPPSFGSPSSLTKRLELTPKQSSLNQSGSKSLNSSKSLNIHSDWSLRDLNEELDELQKSQRSCSKVKVNVTHSRSRSPLVPAAPIGGGGGGGGGGGFRISLTDSSESSGSSDDEEDSPRRTATTRSKGTNAAVTSTIEEPIVEQGFQVPRETVEEANLFEAQQAQLQEVQESIRSRRKALENALWEEQKAENEAVENVQKQEIARLEALRQLDIQDQRAMAEMRDEFLSDLQREHAQQTQVGERKLKRDAAVEEAKRRQLAEAQAEKDRQAKAASKAALEAAKQVEEKKRAEAQKKAQEEAKVRSENEKAKSEAATKAQEAVRQRQGAQVTGQEQKPTTKDDGVPKPRVSEGAAKEESLRLQKLKDVEAIVLPLLNNDALKKDRKTLRRKINLVVQQISATESQIRLKTNELMQLLMDPAMPQQLVALWLAEKFLLQCQAQPRGLSFALAQVVVDVSTNVPLVMELTLARLNEVCIYTVPKYFVYTKEGFSSEEDYFKKIGYEEVDGKLESTDAYVSRMTRYVAFFTALAQTDSSNGVSPFGLKEGWIWFARLLNKLPANRITAAVLRTFLEIAGYRLYREYPRPFLKAISAIHQEFLPLLVSQNDLDASSEYNNLETYIVMKLCLKEPDGRKMPKTDASSFTRA